MRPSTRSAISATAAALTTCLALAACSTTPDFTSGGKDLPGLADSLGAIDATWRATFAGTGPTVNLPASARCYVEATTTDEVGGSVVCGPVRIAGDGETTFQSHSVTTRDTASGWGLTLAPDNGASRRPAKFTPRAHFASAARFVDADGIEAPLDDPLDPPALDRAAVDDPVPLGAPLQSSQTVTARTPAGPVSLQTQLTSGVIGPPERQVQPPVGGSLLLIKGAKLPDAADAGVDLSVTVSHDGSDVRLSQNQLADGLVVGLPRTKGAVTLSVGYDGGEQRFDAATGRRIGDPAASFYDGIGDKTTASCPAVTTSTTAEGRNDGRWQQRYRCRTSFTRSSYLPPTEAGSPRTVHGWADDGQTWVVLSLEPDEQTSWSGSTGRTDYTPSYFSFGTRLRVAGRDYDPRQLYVDQAEGDRPARVTAIFQVPAGQGDMALKSFVTTNLDEPVGGKNAPSEGAFTYPADATFTFATVKP